MLRAAKLRRRAEAAARSGAATKEDEGEGLDGDSSGDGSGGDDGDEDKAHETVERARMVQEPLPSADGFDGGDGPLVLGREMRQVGMSGLQRSVPVLRDQRPFWRTEF